MASHPNPPVSSAPIESELDEKPLSYEGGWALFESLRGTLKESYAKLGGAEDYHRKEREEWSEGE
jgi:hypothetical protein